MRVFVAEQHLQGLAVEALAVADIAGHIHIGQELHFDSQFALSLAGFTAPAVHVERETPGLVAAHFAFGQFGIQFADLIEQACVRAGVRARRAPDRRLVNVDDLVEMLDPFDALMFARRCVRDPSILRQARCTKYRSSTWTCPSLKHP